MDVRDLRGVLAQRRGERAVVRVTPGDRAAEGSRLARCPRRSGGDVRSEAAEGRLEVSMTQGGGWGGDGEGTWSSGSLGQTGRGRDFKAEDEQRRRDRAEVKALCREFQLPLPWGPYRASPFTCWKCATRILVYSWVGHEPAGTDRPPSPRPWTLEERWTSKDSGGRVWVNTCPRCRMSQGEGYLYARSSESGDAPFLWLWTHQLPTLPGGGLPSFLQPRPRPRRTLDGEQYYYQHREKELIK